MLGLYHAAVGLSGALDRVNIATVLSRVRNVPREGRVGPTGKRPDQLPVGMPGLSLGFWPHRDLTAHSNTWESRGVSTLEIEDILRSINVALMAIGTPPHRLTQAFNATRRINEVLHERGMHINYHCIYTKRLLEADIFFLSITPWDNGPVFPPNMQRAHRKVSVGGSTYNWDLRNVWPGPIDPGMTFEAIASAKRFGQVWKRRSLSKLSESSESPKAEKKGGVQPLLNAVRAIQMAMRLQKSTSASKDRGSGPRLSPQDKAEVGLQGPQVHATGPVPTRSPEASVERHLPQSADWDIGQEQGLQHTEHISNGPASRQASRQTSRPGLPVDNFDVVRL
eukprot:TRINITY_DN24804_c0_g1_i1.p1 TRINITY_DN24804_c0_g1~~TRINITY_DN24804_c0_g1_i1.p1  ORF type:complete len:377 (-),score=39.23 TRINITY_DN24804_c0_g1_i1:404-1417(-)